MPISAVGQKLPQRGQSGMSRFTPKSRHSSGQLSCPLCAIGALFDHLVGGGKHRLRNCQAQGFSGFEVDGELDFRGLLDR
jgi:hypothetical protein